MSWRHAVGTSLSSDVTVNLASTSWQQLGGTGAVSYGRYWLNCWKKEIIVDANSLASVGRNPVEKCRDRKTALSKLQIFEHHGVLEYIEMLKREASHILIYPTPYYSLLFWASATDKTTINPSTDQTIPCCNTAMDKSNPKVMDAAFSDTRDCLVSRGELLNVRMVNLWQYSSFSNNRWGQLKALSSFSSSFQSKAHLLNDPANTDDRTAFPSNANWPSKIEAIPMATIFRMKGVLSTVSSASCNNRGSLVLSRCVKSERTWPLGREAANCFNTPISTCGSIISWARLSGEVRSNSHTEDHKYFWYSTSVLKAN